MIMSIDAYQPCVNISAARWTPRDYEEEEGRKGRRRRKRRRRSSLEEEDKLTKRGIHTEGISTT
jgi:hypothetical protein